MFWKILNLYFLCFSFKQLNATEMLLIDFPNVEDTALLYNYDDYDPINEYVDVVDDEYQQLPVEGHYKETDVKENLKYKYLPQPVIKKPSVTCHQLYGSIYGNGKNSTRCHRRNKSQFYTDESKTNEYDYVNMLKMSFAQDYLDVKDLGRKENNKRLTKKSELPLLLTKKLPLALDRKDTGSVDKTVLNSILSTPILQRPDVHMPDYEKPVMHMHDFQRPVMHMHDIQRPVMHMPNYERPVIHMHDHQRPVMHMHDFQKPVMHMHHYQKPEMHMHEYQKPVMHMPNYQIPDIHMHDYQRPNMYMNNHQKPFLDGTNFWNSILGISDFGLEDMYNYLHHLDGFHDLTMC